MTDLPEEWSTASLAEVATKIGSGATPTGGKTTYKTTGIPLIRSMNIHFSGFTNEGLAYLNEAQAKKLENVSVRPNDVLLNITGASIGRVTIAPPNMNGARVNQHVAIIRLVEGIESKFVSGFFSSPPMQRIIAQENYGVTRQALTKSMIENFCIPVPPLPEQRRIVAKIDSLSAKSKRARDQLDHIPWLVEKYKQAISAAAFRGELTRGWRSQAGRPYAWKDTTLGQLLVNIRYGTSKKCGYDAGAVGVLRIPNVQLGKISLDDVKSADFTDDERKKLRLQEGDILIIRSNGSLDLVGRSAVVDKAAVGMLFAGYLIRLRLNNKLASPEFVQLYLRTTETRTLVERLAKSTSGVNNINSTQIQQLPISHPDVDEQHEIVRRIETAFTWIDRLASEATNARKLIDHLDKAVLAKAFRGELVPQDPTDEPASVLLDRIRAQQQTKAPRDRKTRRATGPRT